MITFMPVLIAREPGIDILVYKNQYELMYSLARFQEYYENPVLAGKFFFRDELQRISPDYYIRWNGCNFPPTVIEVFREYVKLLEIDQHEAIVLNHVRPGCYILGLHLESDIPSVIQHERAHALYYMDPGYKALVDAHVVPKEVEQALRGRGYPDKVVRDEYQAYLVAGWQKLGIPMPDAAQALRGKILNQFALKLDGLCPVEETK